MLAQLSILSLASAVVEMDFTISNSRDVGSHHGDLSAGHERLVRRLSRPSNNTNTSSIEPVINASLTPSYNFYHGKLLVGSPPQELDMLLDTGSPVTWVYGPQGSYHNAPIFYQNKSSTFKNGNQSFSAQYGSGQYLGHWGTDLVSAPQFVALNQTHNTTNSSHGVPFELGVVSSFATSAGAPGLLGLGPHITGAGPASYLSLPEAYAKYNVTTSPAFSVFLEESAGRFLFGGVDLKYAELPLYRFHNKPPLSASPNGPGGMGGGPGGAGGDSSWSVFLDSVSFDHGAPYTVRGQVTLDTGSPVSLLPPGFVDAIGKTLGMSNYSRYETYYTNDTRLLPNKTLTFNFGSLNIDIDVKDLLIPGEYVWLDDGPKNVQALGFIGSPNYLLGDAFFRKVYTVLDPKSGDVFLAKRTTVKSNATNNTNSSTVVPFSSLLANGSAIVNASSSAAQNATISVGQLTTSRDSGDAGVTPAAVLQNRYLGTVPAEKAASISSSEAAASSASAASASSTRSASGAASSSASGSASSSKSASSTKKDSKNAASTGARTPFMLLSAVMFGLFVAL